MVRNKSSGTISVNYEYNIFYNEVLGLCIEEKIGDCQKEKWVIDHLIKQINGQEIIYYKKDSKIRMYEWLKENHPEILL